MSNIQGHVSVRFRSNQDDFHNQSIHTVFTSRRPVLLYEMRRQVDKKNRDDKFLVVAINGNVGHCNLDGGDILDVVRLAVLLRDKERGV